MTRTPARSCERKLRHPTKNDANQHLTRLIRDGASPHALEVYHCRHCGAWHVGHRLGYGGRRT